MEVDFKLLWAADETYTETLNDLLESLQQTLRNITAGEDIPALTMLIELQNDFKPFYMRLKEAQTIIHQEMNKFHVALTGKSVLPPAAG